MTSQASFDPTRIDLTLVRKLIVEQFAQFAHLPIRPVAESGWDNRTFHLGDALSIRLPSGLQYAAAVHKEQTWLPRLAPHLPVAIPTPVGKGEPSDSYPFPWSIYKWLPGEQATAARITNSNHFARELAEFLNALQAIDAKVGPSAGPQSHHRGADLAVYDQQARQAIGKLRDHADLLAIRSIWESALQSSWNAAPVWVHGDFSARNLLVHNGHLSAVIDYGQLCVGDPACDLSIAWTFLTPISRREFQQQLALDANTWSRGKGWALWKAIIVVSGMIQTAPSEVRAVSRALAELISDFHQS